MADDADRAQEFVERELEALIRLSRSAERVLKPQGSCYNCEESLRNPDALFCNKECEEDFRKRTGIGGRPMLSVYDEPHP